MMNQISELKCNSKSLEIRARKLEKEKKNEMLKAKMAIRNGNTEAAHIYAGNAIRKHGEQMNHLRLASRIDAIASQLDSQLRTQEVGKSMASVVKSMESVVKSLDPALTRRKLLKMVKTVDRFEEQCMEMEVRAEYMAESMSLSPPESCARELQREDDYGLEAPVAESRFKEKEKVGRFLRMMCLAA